MAVEKQLEPIGLAEAEASTIVRCEVGSTVHGLGVAGTDDRDEMGVCIEPPEWVIGLKHFEQVVHRTKPEGVRSEAGDLDLVIYGLRKYASLALKGNPSILLLLNVPDEKCSVLTDRGRALRRLAPAFASRRAGNAFLGYMQQQRERLEGRRGQMRVNRPELVEQYGFDTKYAGHLIRLSYQGIEYVTTGRFTIPMRDEHRDLIVGIRTGTHTLPEVLALAEMLEGRLKACMDGSPLPEQPQYDVVNQFLIGAYTGAWGEEEEWPPSDR